MSLAVSDGIVRTEKDLAGIVDLTDEEIQKAYQIIVDINNGYANKYSTPQNLQALEDEVKTKLMDEGILVSFDPTPVLQGQPPILEIVGKVSTDPIHKYGFDHEKKYYEVNKANERKEAWHGQKGRINKPKK